MKSPATFLSLTLALLASPMLAQAHSAHAVFDKAGDRPGFTALARATCFNDGAGEPAWLEARIRDNSAPAEGLYLSLQIVKGDQAISTTDTVSGDAGYSERIAVYGGSGVYTLLLTHTRAGAREFDIEYHCMAANGSHAGTDMVVVQYQ
ncbi:MAG TPA: hypothetical protein VNR18_04700 [Hyphomicrobiales bacterium]|nr:hypothetical protein [Hyphomicrobiales bacterium]